LNIILLSYLIIIKPQKIFLKKKKKILVIFNINWWPY